LGVLHQLIDLDNGVFRHALEGDIILIGLLGEDLANVLRDVFAFVPLEAEDEALLGTDGCSANFYHIPVSHSIILPIHILQEVQSVLIHCEEYVSDLLPQESAVGEEQDPFHLLVEGSHLLNYFLVWQ
jgi:hypothetical protein